MYHKLLQTKPAEWEMLREAASQSLGNPVSPMWFPMKKSPAHPSHLKSILESRGPHIAARLGQVDHSSRSMGLSGVNPEATGGGFFDAIEATAKAASVGALVWAGHKIGPGLMELGRSAVQAGRFAAEQGAQVASQLGSAAQSFGTAAGELGQAAVNLPGTIASGIGTSATNLAQGAVNSATGLVSSIGQGVGDLGTALADIGDDVIVGLRNAAPGILTDLADDVGEFAGNALAEVAKNPGVSFVDGIDDLLLA